jgi:hypothetical protein
MELICNALQLTVDQARTIFSLEDVIIEVIDLSRMYKLYALVRVLECLILSTNTSSGYQRFIRFGRIVIVDVQARVCFVAAAIRKSWK